MTPWLLLLSGLAAPEWPVREACHEALALAGHHADPVLVWGLWSDDAELRRRVNQLLSERRPARGEAGWRLLWADLHQHGPYRWPWIDSLPPCPERGELAYEASQRGGPRYPGWPHYRDVTREWAERLCRQGHDWREVRDMLHRMTEHERGLFP